MFSSVRSYPSSRYYTDTVIIDAAVIKLVTRADIFVNSDPVPVIEEQYIMGHLGRTPIDMVIFDLSELGTQSENLSVLLSV